MLFDPYTVCTLTVYPANDEKLSKRENHEREGGAVPVHDL